MSLNTHLYTHADALCSPVFHCRLRIKGRSVLQHLLLSYCIYDFTTAFAAVSLLLCSPVLPKKNARFFFKKMFVKNALKKPVLPLPSAYI